VTEAAALYQTSKVLAILDRIEEKLLCLLLVAMILLACLQIFLRTVYSGGLLWIDPLLRYLVLWSGLVGAVTATAQGKHIALDIFAGRMPARLEPWIALLAQLFASLAAAGLAWAGWLFLAGEIEAGGDGPLALPLWFWNTIFPVAFSLIAGKSALLLVIQARALAGSKVSPDDKRQ
jgi:TRAP-type C4-dicarboxylate transport system permease small subunit